MPNMKLLGIKTDIPTFKEVPKDSDDEAVTHGVTTKTSIRWPDNWHQLTPKWRALLLRELLWKIISGVVGRDAATFEEFKKLTGWGSGS